MAGMTEQDVLAYSSINGSCMKKTLPSTNMPLHIAFAVQAGTSAWCCTVLV